MSIARAVLEFVDVPVASSWNMPPEAALRYFQGKGLQTSFNYQDMVAGEHARAFTVAKMMDTDLLADVQRSLIEAQAKGIPYKAWADNLVPMLQERGWWGKQVVEAPGGGQTIAQLGSPARLQTIYRTNMQAAYAAGQWDDIQDQADLAPYLMYDAVDDARTRPEHRAWDGVVLPVSHPWWQTHYPPNGWNCRCSVVQLSDDDLVDLGLEVSKVPKGRTHKWKNPATGETETVPDGIDPGWAANVGEARNKALQKTVTDKVASYPPALQQPAAKGLEAAAAAGKDILRDAGASARNGLASTGVAEAATVAGERVAARRISDALKDGTPYLAPALRTLQATPAGKAMSATDLLAKAQASAARADQQAAIAAYRRAYIAGRKPSGKASAAFDALPDDARAALRTTMDAARADAALQRAAAAELADIRALPEGSPQRVALEAAEAAAPDGARAAELLASATLQLRTAESRLAMRAAIADELRAVLVNAGIAFTEAELAAMVERLIKLQPVG